VLQQAAAATTTIKASTNLFGTSEIETSNLLERAGLTAKLRSAMAQERRLLDRASRQATALEKGGNVIDRQKALVKAAEIQLRQDVFDLLKNRPGNLSDALNAAADAIQSANKASERASANKLGSEVVNGALDNEIKRLSLERGGLLLAVDNLKRQQQGPQVVPAILKAVIPDAVRKRAFKAGILVSDAKVGDITEVKISELHVDAPRFQYKTSLDSKSGEVGSLEGVQKWDENLGGVITAWIDPADGKAYVLNGHNRIAAATRLGAEAIAVRFVKAANAEEARANGALTNIAEGQGTALDAAKFLRAKGWGTDQLEALGVPLKKDSARQGAAIARLPEAVFNDVVNEYLSIDKATVLGSSRLDPDAIEKISRVAAQRPGMSLKTFEQLVLSQESRIGEAQNLSLFGADPLEELRMLERADLTSRVREDLLSDKRLFTAVSSSRAADLLAKAGSQIDTKANATAAAQAGKIQAVFDALKNLSGPVGSALGRAAEAMLNVQSADEKVVIRARALDEVTAAVLLEMGGDLQPVAVDLNQGTLSLF